ncbi:hypothetical protein [Planosporangium thailandense]|nr:hypothetical protein [Planosporangium thailandense]
MEATTVMGALERGRAGDRVGRREGAVTARGVTARGVTRAG